MDAELKFTHAEMIHHQSKALIQLSYAWLIFYNQAKLHIALNQLASFCSLGY